MRLGVLRTLTFTALYRLGSSKFHGALRSDGLSTRPITTSSVPSVGAARATGFQAAYCVAILRVLYNRLVSLTGTPPSPLTFWPTNSQAEAKAVASAEACNCEWTTLI